MDFSNKTCKEFTEALSTKEPVPGGGGASALVGAVGTALGCMVGSLTVGKKKYAAVEEDIQALMQRSRRLQAELLTLIDRDAEVFAPLARAYGMPKDTEEQRQEKERVMEAALLEACSVPMEIMEKCCEAIRLVEEYAAKGSVMAISDAGVAAACLEGALKGASLNVYINTKAMKDREKAESLNRKADDMLFQYTERAKKAFESVKERLV